jgi:GH15 family glucan-1,4-alpha-glucosidase
MLIEDYGLIGDTHSAALVSRDGSIDWLCLPRFDSPSCFGAILDPTVGGHWRISPESGDFSTDRSYRRDSMVLETTFHTSTGSSTLIDCLPLEGGDDRGDPRTVQPRDVVVRVIRGRSGSVPMTMSYAPRFDYGEIVPWMRVTERGIEAIGGPDALDLQASVPVELDRHVAGASFEIDEGQSVYFAASYRRSHLRGRPLDLEEDSEKLIDRTDDFWRGWAARCTYDGRWREEVVRSLLVLKALTYSPTGGIVAAPTTSLPEDIGGVRNWDYRYCWLRDATFELEELLDHGYTEEAAEWRDWLLRAVAGDPEDLQIMYGVRGERRLTEIELGWLRGYEGSHPVRIGNAAVNQLQLDVYGEVMDALHSAERAGNPATPESWELQKSIVECVCELWREPDEGIWEVRSGRCHFVHSKVMAWVALDRAVSMVENFGRRGPVDHWRAVRSEIREEVLTKGYDQRLGRFTRAYDDVEVDAALLILPLVGFLDATDERMSRTIDAVENELLLDGFVHRYKTDRATDGLPGGEGSFLMCTLWLVDCLVLLGRHDQAEKLFESVLSVRNDLGLLAEQYDVERKRLVGNFPQAFSHVAVVTAATGLERAGQSPGLRRGHREGVSSPHAGLSRSASHAGPPGT